MNKFLTTLVKEKKIEQVEFSENLVDAYLEKSNNSLKSAKVLFESSLFENSVSMSYYAMYNIIVAFFYKHNIKCENHTGAIILLKEIFDEKDLSNRLAIAKKERIDKQYYPNYIVTSSSTESFLRDAKEFTEIIKSKIIMVSNEDINKIKERLFY